MKKLFWVLLISLISSSTSFAQLGYHPGMIFTFDSDTINCLVPIDSHFGKKFFIKKGKDTKPEIIHVRDIKYLATQYKVYENVHFMKGKKEEEKLMQILLEGRINLYMDYVINEGASQHSGGLRYTPFKAPTITYVLRKEGITYYITKKNFSKILTPLISDVPDLVSKIGREGGKFDDLSSIIEAYNSASS